VNTTQPSLIGAKSSLLLRDLSSLSLSGSTSTEKEFPLAHAFHSTCCLLYPSFFFFFMLIAKFEKLAEKRFETKLRACLELRLRNKVFKSKKYFGQKLYFQIFVKSFFFFLPFLSFLNHQKRF
jgi:hypothetical protein